MKNKIITISLLLAAGIYYAQEKESTIQDVEIQSKFLNTPYKKINENIIVITKEELKRSPSFSIDEVLQQHAGIDVRRRGSNGVQSDISIRGGSFEQVLILLNGIRMNDSQTGHNSMNIPVDVSNVERIEVMKGPAARRFGNGPFTGVINIITKTSGDETVKISASGGDYKTYDLGLSSTFGTEKFTNIFQVNSGASEGYRHNTDYKINNVFYQNQYQIKDGKIQMMAGFSEKKFGANGFYASPLATEQYEEVQASLVALKYEQSFGNFNLNSNVFWRRGQDMYLFNRKKPEIYRNMHLGNNVGAEVNGSYKWSLGTTGLGAEMRKEMLASNNLGHRERMITQLFFEHHFSFINNRLQVSPGISWANYSGAGNFFYPGLDVGFDINENNKIYGNIAKVHRIPTFTDLYYVSRTEAGNPNLKPESALSYELGYRFIKNNLVANIGIFGRDTSDMIDWTKQRSTELWRAGNVGNVMSNGLDFELRQNFNGFVRSYSLGYTYIKNTQTNHAEFSRYILDHLKHQLVAKLENRLFGNLSNQLVYRYQERANGYRYHLLDEKMSYKFNTTEVFILINNLINTNYTEAFGVPMPRRWFHVGFTWNLKFN